MNQYTPLIQAWETLEDEFPLTISDLYKVLFVVLLFLSVGLGVLL